MTAAKHTPGPWQVGSRHTSNGVWTQGGDLIASTHSSQRAVDRDAQILEQDANARLIAAAPELLDALRKCVNLLEETERESGRLVEYGEEDPFRMGEWFECDDNALFEAARAAIAKAEGQTPTDDARNCQIGAI